MPAPVASGWSQSPGGPCTHWKSAALSRRTWKPDLGRPDPDRRGCAETRYSPGLAPRDQRKAAITLPWRRTAPDAFAPTAAAVRRQRPRIEVGDGDVVAGIIGDDQAPIAAVAPVGYSSSGVSSVPYGPDRVGRRPSGLLRRRCRSERRSP